MNKESLKGGGVLILACLNRNVRKKASYITRGGAFPVTTLHHTLKGQGNSSVVKYSTNINFEEQGYAVRAKIPQGIGKKKRLIQFFQTHPCTKQALRIKNGRHNDLIVEMFFSGQDKLDEFLTLLENKHPLEEKTLFSIVEDVKREGFLYRSS